MKMLEGLRSRCTMGGSFSSRAAIPRATPNPICNRSARLLFGVALHMVAPVAIKHPSTQLSSKATTLSGMGVQAEIIFSICVCSQEQEKCVPGTNLIHVAT